jgi:hypothetical protein
MRGPGRSQPETAFYVVSIADWGLSHSLLKKGEEALPSRQVKRLARRVQARRFHMAIYDVRRDLLEQWREPAQGRCNLIGLSPQRLDDALGLCHHAAHDLPSGLDILHQSHALPSEKLH